MSIISVKTSKNYDVIVEEGSIKKIGNFVSERIKPCKVALISDSTVFPIYGDVVSKNLIDSGFSVCPFTFAAGEENKNLNTVTQMIEFCAQNQLTRSDLIVALGGGVTGDMAGFAAACYLRGIRFVQVPTTLLAMVDSSVGGKTGCNLQNGKNLVGAFYQPELVVCDADVLQTLSPEHISCGLAEAIKTGILGSANLFELFKGGVQKSNLSSIMEQCIRIKAEIVSKDEKEGGLRKVLNFGHTMAHGIEKLSDYKIPHGFSVSMGMVIATQASVKNGICSESVLMELIDVLNANNLPVKTDFSLQDLCCVAEVDKKRSAENITLVLPEKIGKCVLKDIKIDNLKEFLAV